MNQSPLYDKETKSWIVSKDTIDSFWEIQKSLVHNDIWDSSNLADPYKFLEKIRKGDYSINEEYTSIPCRLMNKSTLLEPEMSFSLLTATSYIESTYKLSYRKALRNNDYIHINENGGYSSIEQKDITTKYIPYTVKNYITIKDNNNLILENDKNISKIFSDNEYNSITNFKYIL